VVSTRTRNVSGACASQNGSSGWSSGLSADVDGGVAGTTGCPGSVGTAVPAAHTSAAAFSLAGAGDFATVAHPMKAMPAATTTKRRRCIAVLGPQVLLEERIHPLPRVAHHEAPIEVVILARIHHEGREIRFPGFEEMVHQQHRMNERHVDVR